jgi:hypothetical protein
VQTLSFLQCVLPPAPAYFMQLLVCDDPQKTFRGKSIRCYSLEHLASCIEAATAKGYDVFVSMAGYPASAKGHYAQFAQSHRTFYLDLDCGPGKAYPDQLAALNALVTFIKLTGLPAPLIVSSGNGVHAHWPVDVLDGPRWLKVAYLLQAVCVHAGFLVDPKITTDSVRLLRPTGTLNRKVRNVPKPVQLLYAKQENYQPLDTATFLAPLVAYAHRHGLSAAPPPPKQDARYDSDLAANMPGAEPYSANQIGEEGCNAVKWFMHNGGDGFTPKGSQTVVRMSNSDWMSMARLAKFSTEGEAWFHEHGAKYKGYVRSETQGVLNRSNLRGVTCETLVTDPLARQYICGRCRHYTKISTPLNLGTAHAQPMDEIPAEDLQQPATPAPDVNSDPLSDCPPAMERRGYSHDGKGVWHKGASGPKTFVSNYMIVHAEKVVRNAEIHHYIIR